MCTRGVLNGVSKFSVSRNMSSSLKQVPVWRRSLSTATTNNQGNVVSKDSADKSTVLVSTPYADHIVTDHIRTSTLPLSFFDYQRFKEKTKAARSYYRQEWLYFNALDGERQHQRYLRVKLDKLYRGRVKAVERRKWEEREAKREQIRQRYKAQRLEQKRANWLKQRAYEKAVQNFQTQYLLHERKQFWLEKPEDINEKLFETQTSLTGFWPEPRRAKRIPEKKPELGRLGPFPVVEDTEDLPHEDNIYLDSEWERGRLL